jgi:hypothetical protein
MTGESKLGDVYLRRNKSRCCAYWRAVDGTSDVFLCSIDLIAYRRHPHLRDLLVELASEVALNLKREAGSSVTLRAYGTAEVRP